MSNSLDKLKALNIRLKSSIDKKNATSVHGSNNKGNIQTSVVSDVNSSDYEVIRKANIERVKKLYNKLNIFEKSPDFSNIFIYKAMNLSGIGLKEDDFGVVREGKYIQIIAITYEPDKSGKKKAKNISLGYFGKAETLEEKLKNDIIDFVLRWRYEKTFQNVEHYKYLVSKINL